MNTPISRNSFHVAKTSINFIIVKYYSIVSLQLQCYKEYIYLTVERWGYKIRWRYNVLAKYLKDYFAMRGSTKRAFNENKYNVGSETPNFPLQLQRWPV